MGAGAHTYGRAVTAHGIITTPELHSAQSTRPFYGDIENSGKIKDRGWDESVNSFLCKTEDLSSDSQNPNKNCVWQSMLIFSVL